MTKEERTAIEGREDDFISDVQGLFPDDMVDTIEKAYELLHDAAYNSGSELNSYTEMMELWFP